MYVPGHKPHRDALRLASAQGRCSRRHSTISGFQVVRAPRWRRGPVPGGFLGTLRMTLVKYLFSAQQLG